MTAVFICQHCTGHLFGHAPGCPVSKAMIEWRVAALAAHPVPDSGLREALDRITRINDRDLDVKRLARAILAAQWYSPDDEADALIAAQTLAAKYAESKP